MMTKEEIKIFLEPIPHFPGVYRYFNKDGEMIYVGKAKNLRKRVASYFTKTPESRKTRKLVESINRVEFTIVDTERDALLLENSFIKEFRPRYNINLKDDKSYPYVVIKNETFPRVFLTRNKIEDGSEYFGPFTNVGKIRSLLDIIRTLIPIRSNNHNLFIRVLDNGKLKVYPEYFLKNGGSQLEMTLDEEDYLKGLQQVRDILKGKVSPIISFLKKRIASSIVNLEFESAEFLQGNLEFLKKYEVDNVVTNTTVGDIDIFSIHIKSERAFINHLRIRKGAIVESKNLELKRNSGETKQEILRATILNLQGKRKKFVREMVLPFALEVPYKTVIITVPQRGVKKKLLDLSIKNLMYYVGSNMLVKDKKEKGTVV